MSTHRLFQFAAVGSVLLAAATAMADVTVRIFNAADQLTTVQTPSQTVSFSYDRDGLQFSKSTAAGSPDSDPAPRGPGPSAREGTRRRQVR